MYTLCLQCKACKGPQTSVLSTVNKVHTCEKSVQIHWSPTTLVGHIGVFIIIVYSVYNPYIHHLPFIFPYLCGIDSYSTGTSCRIIQGQIIIPKIVCRTHVGVFLHFQLYISKLKYKELHNSLRRNIKSCVLATKSFNKFFLNIFKQLYLRIFRCFFLFVYISSSLNCSQISNFC